MPKRLIITQVCFHICTGLLIVFAIASIIFMLAISHGVGSVMSEIGGKTAVGTHNGFPSPADIGKLSLQPFAVFSVVGYILAGFAVLFAAFIEFVSWGLRKRAYWAWISGIVVCGLLITSGLHNFVGLVLGGLALWGLVDPETVAAFKPAQVNNAVEVDLTDKE